MDNLKDTKTDSGLRVSPNGSIRVKKSIFYARKEVQNILSKMKASNAYPKHSLK